MLLYSSRCYFFPICSVAKCILIQLLQLLTEALCPVCLPLSLSSSNFCFLAQLNQVPYQKKKGACLSAPVLSLRRTPFLLLNSFRALRRYFSVNQSSGELTLRQDTPPGSYWLRVGVSDGVWPDVISGVRVHVRDLEEKAILSSASLRLTGNV